jgi:predicted DNA binding CopG/RHH family protein
VTCPRSDARAVQIRAGSQDVTTIQIVSQNKGEPYDFYLDDLFFNR